MKLHHTGIAVANIEVASQVYKSMGFAVEKEKIFDSTRNINILFMCNGDARIELIEKGDKEIPSPVDRFISGRIQHNIYHFCYESDAFEEDIRRLTDNSFTIIEPPKSAVAIEDKLVCFLYNRNVGIVEIVKG